MGLSEDRPSTEERYGKAIDSKHLQLRLTSAGDVDMLISAGWVDESLGTLLLRSRHEWDAARGDYLQARANAHDAMELAERMGRAAARLPDDDAQREAADKAAKALRERAEATALTDRLMILVHLKTLRQTRQAVGAFALQQAVRVNLPRENREVIAIAGRSLEFWLDPYCAVCNGTGLVGSLGTARLACPACRGRRRRDMRLAPDDMGHAFGIHLATVMDRKTDNAANQLKAFLYTRERAEHGDIRARAELQKRLDALRSKQAQED